MRVLVIPEGAQPDQLSPIERVADPVSGATRRITWREVAAENGTDRIEPYREGLVAHLDAKPQRVGYGLFEIDDQQVLDA